MSDGYPSTTWLQTIRDCVDPFLPTLLPDKIKSKIENQIVEAYKSHNVYEIQWAIRCYTKDIEISHLLGNGDKVVPFLIDEYANLSHNFTKLINTLRTLSKFQQFAPIAKPVIAELHAPTNKTMLYDDLQHLCNTHDVELDIKQCMVQYVRIVATLAKS